MHNELTDIPGADAASASKAAYRKQPPFKRKSVPLKSWDLPEWFQPRQDDLPAGEFFAYVPWIREHTDALVNLIRPHTTATITPLQIIKSIDDDKMRSAGMRFAMQQPDAFRRLIFSRLTPLAGRVKGLIFTFDWHPFMRLISTVCQDLNIPRILIPHESVFAKESMYYVDASTGIDRPNADIVLTWGNLQRDIFVARRYPAERIEVVGAPKFDIYRSGHKSRITREQYCRIFSFRPDRPIVLLSTQPLDSQYSVEAARVAQQQLISDAFRLCQINDWQLIVRTPPSRAVDVIGTELRTALQNSSLAQIDQSGFYRVTPFDALSHCDALISINSTMLFEAQLLEKPSISAKYIDFQSFWAQTSIDIVRSYAELDACLSTYLKKNQKQAVDLVWANEALANGTFDGKAASRIGRKLDEIWSGKRKLETYDAASEFVLSKEQGGGNIALARSREDNSESAHLYDSEMLNADNVSKPANASEALGYDHYLKWGQESKATKKALDTYFDSVGVRPIYIESGFVRSLETRLSDEPGLSLILDDVAPYYTASATTRLQQILNSDFTLSKAEDKRAAALIEALTSKRISKYNHAPIKNLSHLRKSKRAVLLVDQLSDDRTVLGGLANDNTFMEMVATALSDEGGSDIFVKLHPDAISGAKDSALAPALPLLKRQRNITFLTEDVNPYSLFDIVDEVWVVCSGMGFEALMAGKKVRCFGAPFYAGRGLTKDEITPPNRTRPRSVREIFHVAYLMLSRYYNPRLSAPCELEELVGYMSDLLQVKERERTGVEGPAVVVSQRNIADHLHLSAAAHRNRKGEIVIQSGDTGHGVYGPYLPLKSGHYRVVLDASADLSSLGLLEGRNLFNLEVVNADKQQILAEKYLSAGDFGNGQHTFAVDFDWPASESGELHKLEYRIWSNGRAVLTVRRVIIEELR